MGRGQDNLGIRRQGTRHARGAFTLPDTAADKAMSEKYYGPPKDMADKCKLDGFDLGVEETMNQDGINRLIDRLKADFDDLPRIRGHDLVEEALRMTRQGSI
jgi:hypothetical protein